MALIKCPECGREISDKATSCPGCGCPVEGEIVPIIINGSFGDRIELSGEEFLLYKYGKLVYTAEKSNIRIKSKKEPGRFTLGQAVLKVNSFIPSIAFSFNSKADYNTFFSIFSDITEKDIKKAKEAARQAKYAQQSQSDRNVVKCPKCGSTSIQYTTKKLSLGRALVGDAVAGAPGAILGGLSSDKGYAVCMNCGKKWKV